MNTEGDFFRYFIFLSYHGANYHGWQQQHNAPSVQETITHSLRLLLSAHVSLVGCGRTDTGVHAREFYAHFDLDKNMVPVDLDRLVYRLNRFLPGDITIHWICPAPADLHARFSAISRTYRYYLHTSKDPFLHDTSWFVHDIPDIHAMNQGASLLLGNDDFTSFSKLHSAAKTNICRLVHAAWEQEGHRMIFTVTADRFLRNMVRAMVGTLVGLGQGKIDLEGLAGIIEAKDRSDAGQSVPAHGLFLEKVIYPVSLPL